MRYYLDCEFVNGGTTGHLELLSVGLVCEDGRELHLCNQDARLENVNDFIVQQVLPNLPERTVPRPGPDPVWQSVGSIRDRLVEFVAEGAASGDGFDEGVEFWGWCSDFDWVAVCQLFGDFTAHPDGWPHYCGDIQQEADRLGLDLEQVGKDLGHAPSHHDALADARDIRALHEFLLAYEPPAADPPVAAAKPKK